MGLENPIHLAVIAMIVLLLFGAKRLPEMGKSLGSGMRGFKDALSGETPAVELSEGVAGTSPITTDTTTRTAA